MLFYISLFSPLIVLAIAIILALLLDSEEAFSSVMFFGFVLSIPAFIVSISTWSNHADDLGTIRAQQEVVAVYESEVAELNKKLSDFEYPKGVLLNADSPVASIVASISVWQNKLAEARAAEAEAKKSIEQRRYSSMSGVIGFVGDYK